MTIDNSKENTDSTVNGINDNMKPNDNENDVIEKDIDVWNPYDCEESVDKKYRELLDIDNNCGSIKGVVTQVVEQNVIVVDDEHRIKYNCCTFVEPFVGDLVNVETIEKNKVIVKPLRYGIVVAKITSKEDSNKKLIIERNAFLMESSETKDLRVGDVIHAIVIETKPNKYNWRAILFSQVKHLLPVDPIEAYNKELLRNKNNILIKEKISFGKLKLGINKSIYVTIRNEDTEPQTLQSCGREKGENLIEYKSLQPRYGPPIELPYEIPAKEKCFVELICNAKYCGEHKELIVFMFDDFTIGRFVEVTVTDSGLIGSNRFESKQSRNPMFGCNAVIIPGVRLYTMNGHLFSNLGQFHIPGELYTAMERYEPITKVFPQLTEPLNESNYQKRFEALLYLEEYANQIRLRQYNMEGVTLRPDGHYLALTVPGLAEGKPSLILNDKIIVFDDHNCIENNGLGFEGFIHKIRENEIFIRFSDRFHKQFRGGSFKVMFQLSRTLYRLSHRAICSADMMDEVLFPHKRRIKIKPAIKPIVFHYINWINKSLNDQQKYAVLCVLRGQSRPSPYIIFGPPGTGKTVTIIESILQVFDKLPQSRIIACTSANSSADLIATKLLESGRVSETDLIRITALHRINSIPDSVKSVTQIAVEDQKKWLYHRIVVTTTSQAGVITKFKISANHFTHVFIDEAAQVLEPESLIPISLSAIGQGVVVLAGDHKQLGPIVISQKAAANQLNRSLMERLMTGFRFYGKDKKYRQYGSYNPKFVTKLVNNYRTDAIIMSIPSKMFYENELKFINKTDEQLIRSLNYKSPINFIGIKGEELKDPDCTSWYNLEEINQSYNCLVHLYKAGVQPQEIGIITPYRKQVIRITAHIQDMGLSECKVGTIEEFQGLEKRVIILSMVRSSLKNYKLGFIHNPKRFNVAVSRAMALLICIGDPVLLSLEKCWSQLIDYCLRYKSYSGCPFRQYSPNRR